MDFQSGFITLLGRPNAGKSTLLNAIIGEDLAIVSHKVQTTRHRIKGFLQGEQYQLIFSDTPGIIEPGYKLQQRMMHQVKSALEDADLVLVVHDASDTDHSQLLELMKALNIQQKKLLVLSKTDKVSEEALQLLSEKLANTGIFDGIAPVSAKTGSGVAKLLDAILPFIPQSPPYYSQEDLSDLPQKFFVAELIREKIFELYHQELPYHSAVLIQEFTEKTTLIKIRAEIVVHRETQKMIVLGERGAMIKKLGTESRKSIEAFLGQKVFLDLFVKVRPGWRNSEIHLKEYGYD